MSEVTSNLPVIWAVIIATAVLLYVLLDGFDLGVGILFPFARSPQDRDVMVASIAPVWDGNETWLVLGGGGLFAAFPLAYAIIMPAMYLPIGFMLTALIFRGVAFEFRAKAGPSGVGKKWWTVAFAAGSIAAALAQGLVLGGFVQGIAVEGRNFAGGSFDWATPFSLLVAVSLVFGYALLGATWLVIRTEGPLHHWARRATKGLSAAVALAMGAVSLGMLTVDTTVPARWGITGDSVDFSDFLPVAPLPLIAAIACIGCWNFARSRQAMYWPFVCAVVVFLTGFAGLALSMFPYVVPYEVTIWQAAAAENALTLMLIGVSIFLPVNLIYTTYVYWVFRGKVTAEMAYH